MDAAVLAALVLLVAGAAAVAVGALGWWRERAALRAVLCDVVPGGTIRDRDDLVRLKRHLSNVIHFDSARAADPRPPLRARAIDTLRSGEGFCGENARVAVRLLRMGGVPAHRLYLEGRRWGHVVVEHRWEGGWRLFDAHADPATALPDDRVGRVDTADPGAFPNDVEENPWLRAHRLPLPRPLRGVGPLRRFRPPAAVTVLAESPDAVLAVAGCLAALAGAILLLA